MARTTIALRANGGIRTERLRRRVSARKRPGDGFKIHIYKHLRKSERSLQPQGAFRRERSLREIIHGQAEMNETQARAPFRKAHPFFFWGMMTVAGIFLAATAVVASRIPRYHDETAQIQSRMTAQEKQTQDNVLHSRARRSDLAIALLQRELRLKSLQQKGLHLAIDTKDSVLYLYSGRAVLRQVKVAVGPDTTVAAPDGRTWRLVRALGERSLARKETSPVLSVPEWVYVAQGQPVPAEDARQVAGGLGTYVLVLDDGTRIYSQPQTGPFRDAVMPGSFAVHGQDLGAIFGAIEADIPVYIY
jgi:hypothetical protein